MRTLAIYSILFAFIFQLGNRIYVMVNFKINQDYIAENLCEKKDEPESCCEGSCHLTKELNKVEETEQQTPLNTKDQTKKERVEEWHGLLSCQLMLQITSFDKQIYVSAFNNPHLLSGYSSKIDHPPAA